MGGCQNYGPFLGTLPYYTGDPEKNHNFDNHPNGQCDRPMDGGNSLYAGMPAWAAHKVAIFRSILGLGFRTGS